MKRIFVYILATLCALSETTAQVDSLNIKQMEAAKVMKPVSWNANRAWHSFNLAVPVAAVGFALMPADHATRDAVVERWDNDGINCRVDDYVQYLPVATQVAMVLGGMEGRSKNRWNALVADAMAAAMMAAVVNGMKYGIDRDRPNGGSGSFPSGHTATAFMGATLLAHEYGHRSVWIPIAGYTVATGVGMMRVLNNKHYLSDVVVGAAIGILTAELGYWASDAIFNNRKTYKAKGLRLHRICNTVYEN